MLRRVLRLPSAPRIAPPVRPSPLLRILLGVLQAGMAAVAGADATTGSAVLPPAHDPRVLGTWTADGTRLSLAADGHWTYDEEGGHLSGSHFSTRDGLLTLASDELGGNADPVRYHLDGPDHLVIEPADRAPQADDPAVVLTRTPSTAPAVPAPSPFTAMLRGAPAPTPATSSAAVAPPTGGGRHP